MDFDIYKATEKDIDTFFPFFEKSIQTEFQEYTANTKSYFIETDYSKETIQKSLREERMHLFLAKDNEKIVGFMLAMKTFAGIAFGNWITVDRKYQRHGIGKALLQVWEKHAVAEGAHKLHLWTDNRNVEFYKHQGFTLLGKIPDDYYGADDYFFYETLRKSDEKNYLKDFLEKCSNYENTKA